ncbi:MAG: methyl-accepting chemotaxis protein [Aquitalea sp.]|nr:methyl-accepting chemotaxis protein [Aquitalea sp.]
MFGFNSRKQDQQQQQQQRQLQQFQSMLDHVDNLIMLADTSSDNTIFYMNRTARDVLAQHRTMMNQKFRAGVDVNNAHLHSIHQFHRDPDRIRRILQDIAARRITHHEALIPVGDVTFKTKVFPIWDAQDNNTLLCFMASFQDISAEVEAQQLRQGNDARRLFLEESIDVLSSNVQAMSATIQMVAVRTSSASDSADEMLKRARDGKHMIENNAVAMKAVSELVTDTADNLGSLGKQSETIGQIVNVIKDIADQTNLLALNAAIEAARAGEMGRGFAVVADEVRKLAERTTKATQEIGTMIRDIQQEVHSNISAMDKGREQVKATDRDFVAAEEAITSIVEEVNHMRDFVIEIAHASEEQATTAQDISDKLHDITRH